MSAVIFHNSHDREPLVEFIHVRCLYCSPLLPLPCRTHQHKLHMLQVKSRASAHHQENTCKHVARIPMRVAPFLFVPCLYFFDDNEAERFPIKCGLGANIGTSMKCSTTCGTGTCHCLFNTPLRNTFPRNEPSRHLSLIVGTCLCRTTDSSTIQSMNCTFGTSAVFLSMKCTCGTSAVFCTCIATGTSTSLPMCRTCGISTASASA